MASDPLLEVRLSGARAVFMLGAEDDPEVVENVDVEVIADDGSRWSATLLTLHAINSIMRSWEDSGECSAGTYFHCPDLVIVKSGGIPSMTELLVSLTRSGEYRDVLRRVDILE